MEWGFLWIMLALKIPLAMLLWLVWWAVKQTPELDGEEHGDGGSGPRTSHPRGPAPLPSRRGPHREPAPPAPARVRATGRRARTPER
jgi:hypothetical protein